MNKVADSLEEDMDLLGQVFIHLKIQFYIFKICKIKNDSDSELTEEEHLLLSETDEDQT